MELLVSARRLPPPGLRRPTTATKPESALLRVARRYAETEAVRVIAAGFAVAAVVVLTVLGWLWLFRG
jgi:hypothetical protein